MIDGTVRPERLAKTADIQKSVPRSTSLVCRALRQEDRVGIRYDIDELFSGEILIDWSSVGGAPDDADSAAVGMALMGLVAQAALPDKISMDMAVNPNVIPSFGQLLSMLYDIRCSCDKTDFRSAPNVSPAFVGHHATRNQCLKLDPNRILVLLSGGMDSTLATIVLKNSGYDVIGLHVTANQQVEGSEQHAALAVASEYNIPLYIVPFQASGLNRIGQHYSRSFGRYPFYNAVPHGRDIPLAVIASIIARRLGCGSIVFGHDKESRQKVINYRGRQILRHDVESATGQELLRNYLHAAIGKGVSMFSPLAGMSIYAVRKIMYRHFPNIVPYLRSCFWNVLCEECLKCVTIYAMQRHLKTDLLTFVTNPFAAKNNEDMQLYAKSNGPSENLGYGTLMHYAMTKIIDANEVYPDDYWLYRFQDRALASVRQRHKVIEDICLVMDRPAEIPPRVTQYLESLT